MVSVVRALKLNQLNQQEVTMNKLYISLLALATLSSAAYANDRGYDLRDSDTCMGKYCNTVTKPFTSDTMTEASPLAVDENDLPFTSFERLKKISEENDHGRH
jgi:hypothetical protein